MTDNSIDLLSVPVSAPDAPPPPLESAVEPPLPAESFRIQLSLEQVLYAVFFVVALVLRLAELGTVVLGDAEAREALSVFRVLNPRAAGALLTTQHPLMFAANALAMTLGGANNAVVRLPTVLVGLALILMPYLFRRWIGRTWALIATGMLTLSPVLLTASRTISGSVWTLTLALGSVWLIGRFVETQRRPYALAATSTVALLIFASEAPGFLVAVGLVIGLLFALGTADDPDRRMVKTLRETVAAWPWLAGLLTAGITLALVSTVFLLHLDGLAGIGEVVGHSLQGFVLRSVQNPIAFPLLTSLLYEPVFWIFGGIGALIVLREDGTFLQRGLVGWLVAGIVTCLIYPGAGAEHALWLTIPLVGLAAITVERVLTPVQDPMWKVPLWAPWLHGISVIATLSITAIRLVELARDLLNLTPALLSGLDLFRVLFILGTLILVVLLFFIAGSTWGARTAWRGLGIGVLVFLGVYSLSSGWRAAVVGASDAREFWRPHPATQNLNLLEKELVNASLRATGMPYDMPISVAWADDGALAWAIHRFDKATFVSATSPALNGPAILAPRTEEKPKLGAAYVGMDFPVYTTWDRNTMQYWDVVAWVYNRETRVLPTANARIVLWLRSDVYGVPSDSLEAPK